MEIRVATGADWEKLLAFFTQIYRKSHPLQNQAFWQWQFGNPEHGGSIIALVDNRIIGHIGVNRSSGVAWLINLFLDPEWRGKGVVTNMYKLAEEFGPLATTNANSAAEGVYRKMGWVGHANLRRFVYCTEDVSAESLLSEVARRQDFKQPTGHHFWDQPGQLGIMGDDGTSAVDFLKFGGLRLVEIAEVKSLNDFVISTGARWADYVTSWNDPLCEQLLVQGWLPDNNCGVPWLFEPIEINSRLNANMYSKDPLPRELIVRRWDSDIGRVGSLP